MRGEFARGGGSAGVGEVQSVQDPPPKEAPIQQVLLGVEQTVATTDDCWTPEWVFDALGLVFDLDVAAPPGGVPWIPAKRFFTQADDGLSQRWEGLVWCNPPFSSPSQWAHRMVTHGSGVFLGPLSKSSWMTKISRSAVAVFLLPSTMSFVQGTPPLPTGLWAFGGVARDALVRMASLVPSGALLFPGGAR